MKKILLLVIAAFCLASCGKKGAQPSDNNTNTGTVTTIAGGSFDSSYPDGIGANAGFLYPIGITIDASGNLYVTDGRKIRKVTQAGVVTTYAGTTTNGDVDGPIAGALFSGPYGITTDPAGNMYVCDVNNLKIKKITPSGIVSTFAGNGHAGLIDGPAATAEFRNPQFITIDPFGNFYVSDLSSIRKISSAGIVSTLAIGGYNCVATDAAGNVFAANGNAIVKITSNGTVSIVAGDVNAMGFADGQGTNARFFGPNYLIVDSSGNIYVSDTGNFKIRKITSSGMVSTFAGSIQGSLDGSILSARFGWPIGLVMDTNGNIFVADGNAHRIKKITIK